MAWFAGCLELRAAEGNGREAGPLPRACFESSIAPQQTPSRNALIKRYQSTVITRNFFFVLSAFFGREMHGATKVKCGFREGSGGGRKRGAHLETIAEGRDAATATSAPSEGRTAADGNVGFGIWGFEHLLPRFYPARKQGRRKRRRGPPVLDAAR